MDESHEEEVAYTNFLNISVNTEHVRINIAKGGWIRIHSTPSGWISLLDQRSCLQVNYGYGRFYQENAFLAHIVYTSH